MPEENNNSKLYFYLAVACCAAGFIALGLAFTNLGVYSLISSILLGLASLAFAATQKKKNKFRAVTYVAAAAYTLLAVSLLIFIGGLIYSALNV